MKKYWKIFKLDYINTIKGEMSITLIDIDAMTSYATKKEAISNLPKENNEFIIQEVYLCTK